MSKPLLIHTIGLEGCGHHGLSAVFFDLLLKYHEKRFVRDRASDINPIFNLCCENGNLESFETNIQHYFQGKDNNIFYIDCSYPHGVHRSLQDQWSITDLHNILSKYSDLIYIVLERNLYDTINSHPTWDGGITNHAKKLCEIKGFIDNEINILLKNGVKIHTLNYEEIDSDVGAALIGDILSLSKDKVAKSISDRFAISTGLKSINYTGQKGQDKWVIKHVFPNKKRGYFLDLAAADGITHSNTFVLESKYEWDGIAIEPNPIFYAGLCNNRNCKTSNCAISSKREKVLFRIDNGQIGGIVAEDTDNSYKARREQLESEKCKIIELDAYPLIDILENNNVPRRIDYWSLDVEGSEERIISSFDFSKYIFGCITIERPTPKCNQILQDNGYIFVKNHKFDSFYVHPENLGDITPCEFEQVPPKGS